jgi:hypothetical protein
MGIQLSRFKGMRRIFPFVSDSMPFHSPLVFCIAELFRILFGVNQIFTIAAKETLPAQRFCRAIRGMKFFFSSHISLLTFFRFFSVKMKSFPLTAASLFSMQQKMAYPVFSENIGNALFGFASADRLRPPPSSRCGAKQSRLHGWHE